MQYLTAQPFFLNRFESKEDFFSSYSQAIIYKENSNSGSISTGFIKKNIFKKFEIQKHSFSIDVSNFKSWLDNYNSSSKINLSLANNFNKYKIGYSFSDDILQINSTFSAIRINQKNYFNYFFETNLIFKIPILKKITFGIKKSITPINIDANYYDASLHIEHPFTLRENWAEISLSITNKSQISFKHNFNLPFKYSSKEEFSLEDLTKFRNWEVSSEYEDKFFHVYANYLYMDANSELNMYQNQLSFSDIKIPGIYLNYLQLKSKYGQEENSILDFNFYFIKLKTKAVGNLQSWPFTTFVQSIIMNRINFRLNSDVTAFQFEVGKMFKYESINVQPSISYIDIQPEFELESWQPAFLVLGVRDYSYNSLSLTRAGLLSFSFNCSVKKDKFSLVFFIEQVFPVFIKRKEIISPPSTIPGEPTGIKSKSDGGRWFTINLSYEI